MALKTYSVYTRCELCGVYDRDRYWCDLCGRPKDGSRGARPEPAGELLPAPRVNGTPRAHAAVHGVKARPEAYTPAPQPLQPSLFDPPAAQQSAKPARAAVRTKEAAVKKRTAAKKEAAAAKKAARKTVKRSAARARAGRVRRRSAAAPPPARSRRPAPAKRAQARRKPKAGRRRSS